MKYEYIPNESNKRMIRTTPEKCLSEYGMEAEKVERLLDEAHASSCGMWANMHKSAIKECIIESGQGNDSYTVVARNKYGEEIIREKFSSYENASRVTYMAYNGVYGGTTEFKLPLAARIGERMWYINPKFNEDTDNAEYNVENIRECIVEGLSLVSDMDNSTLNARGVDGEPYGAIQECFFDSLNDTISVINVLGKMRETDGKHWAQQLTEARTMLKIGFKYKLTTAEKKWARFEKLLVHGYGAPRLVEDVAITRALVRVYEGETRVEYGITAECLDMLNRKVKLTDEQYVVADEYGKWHIKDTDKYVQFVGMHVNAKDISGDKQQFKITRLGCLEEVGLYAR